MILPDSGPPQEKDRPASSLLPRECAARILLVEDHDDTRTVVARLLDHSGYRVTVADCATAALNLLAAEDFDVLLCDIGLPDGDGRDLIGRAREKHPALRAVALTGFSTEADIQASRDAGFDHHLTKPVDFHQLRSVLAGQETGA